MRNRFIAAIAVAVMGASSPLLAKVTQAEAARLNNELTPVGAERAGNAAGTIPAWDGGLATPPANWREGSVETNPFPGDDALYVVTGDNLDLYRDKLSDGHIRMLEQYGPAFFMPVYETRRTAAFPEHVYEKFRQNALTAELLDNGNGVRDTIMTSPFPIPKNGLEAIWNHILRYRGEEVSFRSASATPQEDGSFNPVVNHYDYFFAYSQVGADLADIDNKIFYLKTETIAPTTLAGTITLVHETLDQVRSPRLAWRYDAGSDACAGLRTWPTRQTCRIRPLCVRLTRKICITVLQTSMTGNSKVNGSCWFPTTDTSFTIPVFALRMSSAPTTSTRVLLAMSCIGCGW